MPVAITAAVLGLIVVLVAYYRDAPVEERRLHPPDWDVLPDPSDVARTEFPLAFPGYDPATVEFHFDLLTRAYADLLAAATPDVVARARRSAALRLGLTDVPAAPSRPAPVHTGHSTLVAFDPEPTDSAALRAEAALADIESQHDDPSGRPA